MPTFIVIVVSRSFCPCVLTSLFVHVFNNNVCWLGLDGQETRVETEKPDKRLLHYPE